MSCPDTNHGHCGTQFQGIKQHTQQNLAFTKQCTTKPHGGNCNIGGLALQKLPIVRGLVIIEFSPPPPPWRTMHCCSGMGA